MFGQIAPYLGDEVLEAGCVQVLHRPVQDGEGGQPEKVELDQTHGFDVILVVLSDQIIATGFTVKRTEIGQVRGGNDHAAGMLARISGQAFQRHRQIDQCLHLFVGFIGLSEIFTVG